MARRTHAHLHRLFRWAVGRGIIAINPMQDLPKIGSETRRDRILSDAELTLAWRAAGEIGWPFGPVYQLLILTGARRDEIGGLRWKEIGDNEITLAGQRTKNARPHRIPLSEVALEIVGGLPRVASSEFAFTTTGGRSSISGWTKAKQNLDAKMASMNGEAVPPWHVHDLRRTVATGLQRLGIGLQVIEEVLGHVSGSRAGIVGVYQRHTFTDEKRAALDAWGRFIVCLADGQQASNVLALRRWP